MNHLDISIFDCNELKELENSAVRNLKLLERTIVGIPMHEIPFLRLKAIDELNTVISQYKKEINKKCSEQSFENSTELERWNNKIFISYSHKDKQWLEKLKTVWKPFERNNKIIPWSDQNIRAGQDWLQEIKNNIETATIAILLVSPNFLASEFINDHELPSILNAAEVGKITIIWIPISHSAYQKTNIVKYQSVYNPKTPLDMLEDSQINQAFIKICEEIESVIENK